MTNRKRNGVMKLQIGTEENVLDEAMGRIDAIQQTEMKKGAVVDMKKGFGNKVIKCMLIALTLALVSGVVFACSFRWVQKRFVVLREQVPVVSVGNKVPLQTEAECPVSLPEQALQAVFVTEEDGALCGCFYTMLDCMEGRMEFYMVPLDTRLYLSTELYRELVTKNAKLAQVNTLDGLYRCFVAAEAAECTLKALDEAVGVQADYYTVMPKSCYERIIKEEAHTYVYDAFLQDDLSEQVMAAGSMKAYLSAVWEQCKCSVSAESRLYYLETYEGLTNLRVFCRLVAGERHNNGYVPKGTGLR